MTPDKVIGELERVERLLASTLEQLTSVENGFLSCPARLAEAATVLGVIAGERDIPFQNARFAALVRISFAKVEAAKKLLESALAFHQGFTSTRAFDAPTYDSTGVSRSVHNSGMLQIVA